MCSMLKISFTEIEGTIRTIDAAFPFIYEEEWFDDPLVREMVLDIDKTEVIDRNICISPVLGAIPPEKLSGGVKSLILMLKRPDLVMWATSCGDNCAKWIIEIAKRQDITIVLEHVMHFPEDFDAICLDTGEEIHCINDYRRCVIECL